MSRITDFMHDTKRIISHTYTQVDNYLLILTKLHAYRYGTKKRRGWKYGYIVSCMDLNSTKEYGYYRVFIKRIHKKKDAWRYYTLLPSYCKNHGKESLMLVWEAVNKSFADKLEWNKDYTITPYTAYKNAVELYLSASNNKQKIALIHYL